MLLGTTLRKRDLQPELMDQPELDEAAHREALAALGRINRFSGTARILWPHIRAECRRILERGERRKVRLLDLATGGGDLPLDLWRRAQEEGLCLEVAGCDVSPRAVTVARERARHDRSAVEFFPRDIVADSVPPGYDILVSSLFLHHLDEFQALEFLCALASTGGLVLIDDLRRTPLGWLLAYAGVRVLSRSRVAWMDGPLSVRGAFTCDEVRDLASRAGWPQVEIRRRWPCRFLLIGRPS